MKHKMETAEAVARSKKKIRFADMMPLSEVIAKTHPAQLCKPDNLRIIYMLFVLDLILASGKVEGDHVWEKLSQAMKDLAHCDNLKTLESRFIRVADVVEMMTVTDDEKLGTAIRQFRKLLNQIDAKKGAKYKIEEPEGYEEG